MDLDSLRKKLSDVNLAEVERETKVSRRTLYNLLENKNTTEKTATKLSEYFLAVEENELYGNLRFFKAPLVVETKNSMSLEEAVFKALSAAKNDGLLESVLPYVLYKNRASLNLDRMYELTLPQGLLFNFCYFLEVANEFSQHKPFKVFLKKCHSLLPKKLQLSPLASRKVPDYALPLFMKNEAGLKWKFLVLGNLKDHLDRYRKWHSHDLSLAKRRKL